MVSALVPVETSTVPIDISEHQPLAEAAQVSTELENHSIEEIAELRNAQREQVKQASRNAEPEKEYIGEFKLSFYTPSPDETDSTPHITASGAKTKPGITVAVDPRYYKFGTRFYIEGFGYVVAEDTGSKIKGPNVMDVCVATKEEAFKHGIQYRKVWLIKA